LKNKIEVTTFSVILVKFVSLFVSGEAQMKQAEGKPKKYLGGNYEA